MNPEILERLLFDRSLGALSPDAAALLGEYLSQHPSATARAAELDSTLELARRALGGERDDAGCVPDAPVVAGSERSAERKPSPREEITLTPALSLQGRGGKEAPALSLQGRGSKEAPALALQGRGSALPPFPLERLRSAQSAAQRAERILSLRRQALRRQALRGLALRGLALAACVLIGVVLGGRVTRSTSDGPPSVAQGPAGARSGGEQAGGHVTRVANSSAGGEANDPAGGISVNEPGGIWSRQRLYQQAALRDARPAGTATRELKWTSPLEKPRLERAL